uniref:Molybdenum cofactor sulfurase middle domain-containing protein n=1 Tax=Neogobius melanostomus TaxID=47308 RepID=A0A8C6TXY7_9GOBI
NTRSGSKSLARCLVPTNCPLRPSHSQKGNRRRGVDWTCSTRKIVRVGVVSQLLVHPLKSGKALSVALAECLRTGLKFGELQDRHWMVVTEDGHMVTGRQEPRLVSLNGPSMEELKFPVKLSNNRVIDCRLFGEDIQGRDCGDAASSWLTRYLNAEKTYRLVHFEPHMKARKPCETDILSPGGGVPRCCPVMLLSEASVKDLSSKLDKMSLWSDSVLISSSATSLTMYYVFYFCRCIFTTVDPETGIITRKEPLETLKRLLPSVRSKTGILQVGDEVFQVVR